MSPFLAPLLAQLVSLQMGDRTEARYVRDSEGRFQGSTVPVAALQIQARRTTFNLRYSPALTLIPLERKPRELYVLHFVSASASYKVSRATSLSLSSALTIGSLNFRLLAAQGLPVTATPAPTSADGVPSAAPVAGAPGTPTTGMAPTGNVSGAGPVGAASRPDAVDQKVRYYAVTTALVLAHQVGKDVQLNATLGTTRASGQDAASRLIYAPLHGWFAGAAAGHTYKVSARDSFLSGAAFMKTWSSIGNEVATLTATETWAHRFDARTTGSLGAGLNGTRFSQANGLRGISVFPTFNLGIAHDARVGRGMLSLAANAFSSPMLDPLRALVDPRVGAGGSIGYTRKKVSIVGSGSTVFSIAPRDNDAGAVDAYAGDVRAIYRLGEVAALDAGARVTRQSYQGNQVIPLTWAAYAGLTFGYTVQLAGNRKP